MRLVIVAIPFVWLRAGIPQPEIQEKTRNFLDFLGFSWNFLDLLLLIVTLFPMSAPLGKDRPLRRLRVLPNSLMPRVQPLARPATPAPMQPNPGPAYPHENFPRMTRVKNRANPRMLLAPPVRPIYLHENFPRMTQQKPRKSENAAGTAGPAYLHENFQE